MAAYPKELFSEPSSPPQKGLKRLFRKTPKVPAFDNTLFMVTLMLRSAARAEGKWPISQDKYKEWLGHQVRELQERVETGRRNYALEMPEMAPAFVHWWVKTAGSIHSGKFIWSVLQHVAELFETSVGKILEEEEFQGNPVELAGYLFEANYEDYQRRRQQRNPGFLNPEMEAALAMKISLFHLGKGEEEKALKWYGLAMGRIGDRVLRGSAELWQNFAGYVAVLKAMMAAKLGPNHPWVEEVVEELAQIFRAETPAYDQHFEDLLREAQGLSPDAHAGMSLNQESHGFFMAIQRHASGLSDPNEGLLWIEKIEKILGLSDFMTVLGIYLGLDLAFTRYQLQLASGKTVSWPKEITVSGIIASNAIDSTIGKDIVLKEFPDLITTVKKTIENPQTEGKMLVKAVGTLLKFERVLAPAVFDRLEAFWATEGSSPASYSKYYLKAGLDERLMNFLVEERKSPELTSRDQEFMVECNIPLAELLERFRNAGCTFVNVTADLWDKMSPEELEMVKEMLADEVWFSGRDWVAFLRKAVAWDQLEFFRSQLRKLTGEKLRRGTILSDFHLLDLEDKWCREMLIEYWRALRHTAPTAQ